MQIRARYQPHPESTCAKVISYAKQRNSRELMRLLRDGYSLDEKSYGRDAIFYLCVSGDDLSVAYLSSRFNFPLIKSLLLGLAARGSDELFFIMFNSSEYANFTTSDLSDLLKIKTEFLPSVMRHFALGGFVEIINDIIWIMPPNYKLDQIQAILNGYVLNGSCQDQIDHWMSDPVIDRLSRETNRSPSSIRDDFSRAVLQARAELGMVSEVNPWNSCSMARGGHEAAVLKYLDDSIAHYKIGFESHPMDAHEISELCRAIDKHGSLEANAAIWFSSELSLKIISSNFSASEKVIEGVISNGHNKLASTWLLWLSKSFWMDEIHYATLKKAHSSVGSNDFHFEFMLDSIKRFFSGERSLDAVMSYQPDPSVDTCILMDAQRVSNVGFEALLSQLMKLAIENNNFSALNMLCDVSRSVLGTNIPRFELSKKWSDHKACFAASCINDSDFRREMLRRFHGGDQNIEVILKMSNLTNYFIRDYLLDFHLARLMLECDVLSAYHLIEAYQRTDEGLPFDSQVFSIIFTMLLGVDEQDARAIYEAIMIHLFESQPPGMNLQHKLDVFGLFKPALPSGDHTPGNDRPFLRC